jgi:hypothetical protein
MLHNQPGIMFKIFVAGVEGDQSDETSVIEFGNETLRGIIKYIFKKLPFC